MPFKIRQSLIIDNLVLSVNLFLKALKYAFLLGQNKVFNWLICAWVIVTLVLQVLKNVIGTYLIVYSAKNT